MKFPYKRNDLKEIGMVAGGTGITPMLQARRGQPCVVRPTLLWVSTAGQQ
ncbi:hypothetical protein MNEG_14364 [Monoraphidium neglectum]|uniref:Uncharacterized protein n=1 Tax=Monoraphidium neglectum TaxID=145388 RepID=A0A0D2MEM1_9CHLO|nr:hypothetical protein MNEG_14364 [Monoraphidium neglectum]KIY93600.1 hypothetical protein MNEG_14364 [Monoraphidium neglectum]|eukprot:XP_013892620.1 hypothetical protein MNEG_14364 [Monoraphidium neglectum]